VSWVEAAVQPCLTTCLLLGGVVVMKTTRGWQGEVSWVVGAAAAAVSHDVLLLGGVCGEMQTTRGCRAR